MSHRTDLYYIKVKEGEKNPGPVLIRPVRVTYPTSKFTKAGALSL